MFTASSAPSDARSQIAQGIPGVLQSNDPAAIDRAGRLLLRLAGGVEGDDETSSVVGGLQGFIVSPAVSAELRADALALADRTARDEGLTMNCRVTAIFAISPCKFAWYEASRALAAIGRDPKIAADIRVAAIRQLGQSAATVPASAADFVQYVEELRQSSLSPAVSRALDAAADRYFSVQASK